MSHEFRNIPNLPHDALTMILVGGGAASLAMLAFAAFLAWRHRARKKPPSKPPPLKSDRGTKRRRKLARR